jgi:hypothetical protein
MPKKTYTQINSVTLAAASASVTFGSIPQNFTDLIVIVQSGGGTNFRIALNGDTNNANFSGVQMSGFSGGAQSSVLTGTEARLLNYYGFMEAGNLNTSYITQIIDYCSTDKHKTYLSRSNNPANGVSAVAGRWANTSAITSVSLISEGTLLVGSTFALYGIEA